MRGAEAPAHLVDDSFLEASGLFSFPPNVLRSGEGKQLNAAGAAVSRFSPWGEGGRRPDEGFSACCSALRAIPHLLSGHSRPNGRSGSKLPAAAIITLNLLLPSTALAHGTEGGIVLLLPTGYYLAGAALAVAASFLLLAILPACIVDRVAAMRLKLFTVRDIPHAATSLLGLLFLATLVVAGFLGSRDPVANPLPTLFWTIWWVCFTVLQAVTGPLWPHLNPWTGILTLLGHHKRDPLATLPVGIGYVIAILQFGAFAWFELIDLAPSDPERLAKAIGLYFLFNLLGAMTFGQKDWMARAEPFSIFFNLIGRLSPIARADAGPNHTELSLVCPGRRLIGHPALPLSGVIFLLLTLSTVSFDGLSRTFLWLGALGINPLEFPGRSAVVWSGTSGLIATFAALSAAFLLCVALGAAMAGTGSAWREAAGRLIYSIVPIALAFQAAHYLTNVLVDGQNALIAVSDPFALGWNLFGTAEWHTTTSFLNTLSGVTLIFNTETVVIALGHVIGIVMAHLIALELFQNPRKAVISQIPLAALMVFYTGFGLWLLSTPRI
jgi:hypothetical protein